jgi:hypothetical protein
VRIGTETRSGDESDESSAVHGSQKVSHDFRHVIPLLSVLGILRV